MAAKRSKPEEIERFRVLVQSMTVGSEVFKMLKTELSAQGRWKRLPRGKPRERGWARTFARPGRD